MLDCQSSKLKHDWCETPALSQLVSYPDRSWVQNGKLVKTAQHLRQLRCNFLFI